MKQFPVTIIDNFYKNPDLVRDFALSLDYHSAFNRSEVTGREFIFPGTRSNFLFEISHTFL